MMNHDSLCLPVTYKSKFYFIGIHERLNNSQHVSHKDSESQQQRQSPKHPKNPEMHTKQYPQQTQQSQASLNVNE